VEDRAVSRSRQLEFLLLLIVSLALWWRPLAGTLRLALSSEAHTHILLILPLCGALIYLERKAFQPALGRCVLASAPFLAAALLICAFVKWGADGLPNGVQLSLSMFALVLWWIGSAILCFGQSVFKSFLFPLCFLFWIVPIPESALNGVVLFLQHESAFAARFLFRVAGVPVTQEGVTLSIAGLDIEVARECSSIRSSLMLVITTMVLAHLFLRSWWRKGLLIAAAIPLSVAKNGLRIFVIAELGTRVDAGFLDGRLHHHGGIIFFGVSMAAVIVLLLVLQRKDIASDQMPAS
jgi:exosortase